MPDIAYEPHCSSDGVRITKQQKVYGFAVCQMTELKMAVITSEGKLLLWELYQPQVDMPRGHTSQSDIGVHDLFL